MPGSDEPPPNPFTKVLADIYQQLASLSAHQASLLARLDAVEARQSVTTITTMSPVFPCGLPGYGPVTPTITITGAQQIQTKGEKLQLIEQPTDMAMEPAGKMLNPSGVGGGAAAGCCARPPSMSVGAGDARSVVDLALHPFVAPPSCASPHGGPRSCLLRQGY